AAYDTCETAAFHSAEGDFKMIFVGLAGLDLKRLGHRAACMHRKRLTMDLCAGISRDSRWRFRRPLSRLRPAAAGLRALPGKTASEEKPPSQNAMCYGVSGESFLWVHGQRR